MGVYPSVRTNYVGEGGEMCSLPFVWGTSGTKATTTLRPAYGVSPFPLIFTSGGVSIATSFLVLAIIIHQKKTYTLKRPVRFVSVAK